MSNPNAIEQPYNKAFACRSRVITCVAFTITFLGLNLKASAQDFFPRETNYGVKFGVDYDLPGKNLSAYNAALNYNISLLKYLDNITLGLTLAYRQYDIKKADWGQAIQWNNWANFSASAYTSYAVYLFAAYRKSLDEKIEVYGGANLGTYQSSSSMYYKDDFTDWYQHYPQKQLYFAPKLGASFAITNYWGIDVHAAYNIFTEGGAAYSNTTSGAVAAGSSMYTSITAGIGLVVKF